MTNRLLQIPMIAGLAARSLQARAGTPGPSDESARAAQSKTGAAEKLVEGFFVVPGVDFATYKKIVVTDLNLADIKNPQIKPGRESNQVRLNEEQERFYRAQYVGAVVGNFIADGTYSTALDAGGDVLILNTAIAQITPPKQQEKASDNSPAMQVFSGNSSSITVVVELFDSVTQQLLATFTDTQDLGQVWEEESPIGYNTRIPLIFDYWMAYMRKELDELSLR